VSRTRTFGPTIIAAIVAVIVTLFWSTFLSLVGVSGNTEESAHTIFVLAAFLILVWEMRSEMASLQISPFPPGVVGVFIAGFIWLAGELVFARSFTYLGMVIIIPMTVMTIMGYRWVIVLRFPLCILLLALPIGIPLIPTLVEWTAKFTVAGLQISGVPVYREGAYLIVPSGAWSIADACSGIAYLRTVTILSILYAWSIYRSITRRTAFVIGAIIIGIVGNWLRAYLTILIAHLSDNRFLRDDHSTFGWILFAILLCFYSVLGYRHRDVEKNKNASENDAAVLRAGLEINSRTGSTSAPYSAFYLVVITIITASTAAMWPLTQRALQGSIQPRAATISDIAAIRGWRPVDVRVASWTPTLVNPARERVQTFEKAGRQVEVFVGVFQNQSWNSKLVTVVNGFARKENSGWSLAVRGETKTDFARHPLVVDTGIVLGAGTRILAWRWYWIQGFTTASDLRAKMTQLISRLSGKPDISAWVSVYANADASPAETAALLDEFMHDMGGSIQQSLQQSLGEKL
jgi:exosortase A